MIVNPNPQEDYVRRAAKKKTDTQDLISLDHPPVELTVEERMKFAAYLKYQMKGGLAVTIAEEIHDGWTGSKAESGYVYGPVRNDDPQKGPLTHPLMKPAIHLTNEELKWDVDTAVATMAQVVKALEKDLT